MGLRTGTVDADNRSGKYALNSPVVVFGRITRYSEKALMVLSSHFIARWQISANQAAVAQ
jgi:hypothetical protein